MANVPHAGRPYTVWIFVVNNPEACLTPGCDEADLARPETRTTAFNASGAIAADNGDMGGVINVDFEVEAGRLPNGWFILDGSQHALRRGNGFKALVSLVIDEHPSPTPPFGSWIADLTQTEPPPSDRISSIALALFAPCPDSSCPESVL